MKQKDRIAKRLAPVVKVYKAINDEAVPYYLGVIGKEVHMIKNTGESKHQGKAAEYFMFKYHGAERIRNLGVLPYPVLVTLRDMV